MTDDKRVRDLGTYEMLWDCKFCGAQGLPAKTHKFCPTCGAAQDPATRRFPSDEEKRAVHEHVDKGADIICAACSTVNDGDAKFCRQCGAPLESAARAETVADEVRAEGEAFAAGAQRDLGQEELQRDLKKDAPTGGKSGMNWVAIALIAAVVICVGGVLLATFWRRGATAYVSGHSWEREIMIESYQPHEASAWCDGLPSDAYNISVRSEQRDSRRVPDGETCQVRRVDNGDGTFSEREECETTYREEPIYDDRCYFTVDRWDYSRSVVSNGDGVSEAPFWAEASLARSSGIGAEREAGRDEHYVVILQGDGDTQYECEVDYAFWQTATDESAWTLEVSALTGQPDCSTLAPAQ